MKVYRNGIFICLIICLSSVLLLIIDQIDLLSKIVELNKLIKQNDKLALLINNMLLGIFASAFVVLITYAGAYKIEKIRTISLVKYYCNEYVSILPVLSSKIVDINTDGGYQYDWATIKNRVETDANINLIIEKLLALYNERLFHVDGYFPILRKNKKNLDVHHLICRFAILHSAIQYCDIAYKIRNNAAFALEMNDFNYSENNLKNYIDVILQRNNVEYQQFFNLLHTVINRHKTSTIYNTKWEGKCS